MEFTGKKGFLKTGSVVALIGLILNIVGLMYLPDRHLSIMYSSEIYLANALSLVGVGLIVIGLAIVLVGMLRVD
jgi:Co/Zn/Cd efflux system component